MCLISCASIRKISSFTSFSPFTLSLPPKYIKIYLMRFLWCFEEEEKNIPEKFTQASFTKVSNYGN